MNVEAQSGCGQRWASVVLVVVCGGRPRRGDCRGLSETGGGTRAVPAAEARVDALLGGIVVIVGVGGSLAIALAGRCDTFGGRACFMV